MNKGIKYIAVGLLAVGTVASSYAGNITVNWGANDVTGISLAGGTTPVPAGDLVEVGWFSSAPTVGSASLAGFTPIATAHVGDNSIPGFWGVSSFTNEPAVAHQQIYIVAFNATTALLATQEGIWDANDGSQSNWKFPASTDIPNSTTLDLENILQNFTGPNPSLANGGQTVFGGAVRFVASDANDAGANTSWMPLQNIVAVPEPSSLVLVALGMLGGLGVIRRRRS